jgi:hypothetical protein
MANRITATMWPFLDKAIMRQVIDQTKPVIEQVKTQASNNAPGCSLPRIRL